MHHLTRHSGRALLLLGILTTSTGAVSQQLPHDSLCHLQGRDLALRAAEQLLPSLTAEQRAGLARLSESTCLEYFENARSANDGQVSREVAAQLQTEEAEEERGLFDDITIIDPQDRPRRPGLKRP